MAQKKLSMIEKLRMVPECHPGSSFHIVYFPERGGDRIIVKCDSCYRIFFDIKLPKEREA